MKRTERHHLKENEVAHWLLELQEQDEAHKQTITYPRGAIAIVIVAAAVIGTMAWRSMVDRPCRRDAGGGHDRGRGPRDGAGGAGENRGPCPKQPAGTFPPSRVSPRSRVAQVRGRR